MRHLLLPLDFLAVLLLSSAASSFSQVAPARAAAPEDGRVNEWMNGESIPPIAKLPFTAKAELETVSQLPDGMLITHKTYNLIARDSAGRTRNEARKWLDPATGAEPKLFRIVLYDPMTKTRTALFPLTKIARQWNAVPAFTSLAQVAGKPESFQEDLGGDTLEGLPVRGVRLSQTYAPGTVGNDRPLTVVVEYWYSEELRINLLTKRTDPRFGVQTVCLTQLVRQEPDASLFAVSDDYKLVNESLSLQQADEALADSAAVTLSSSISGVARAGVGGTTVPVCLYCPNPSYSDKARAAKLQGSVVLQIVVTADGRAETISVVKGPGLGLEEQAIEALRNWRFKPAHGPDGNPVATVVPVQVTFRLK
jgi:TonB family protein